MRHALLAVSLFLASGLEGSPGVEGIFSPGFIVQDRNRDGFVDFVNAEIALGGPPTAGLVAAASDVAARLGLETMALDLPLPSEVDAIRIRVGGPSPAVPPGEGVVASEIAEGRESVVVTGLDEAGTRAAAGAAAYLAGRVPHLRDPKGPTRADGAPGEPGL